MPKLKNPVASETSKRRARLFRNGRNQAVRIPKEFELPGKEVLIHKEGERLILEPVTTESRLLKTLARLKPTDETFPDVDAGLPEADDVPL